MTQNNNQSTALVNIQTGEVVPATEDISREEVIPAQALAHLMDPFRGDSPLPVHIKQLEATNFTDEQKEDLVSAYMGLIPLSFDDVLNRKVPVLGMIIYQHPGFNGMDGLYHPEGFYQVRFLVDLDGEIKVVTSSAVGLAMNVSYIMKRRGWWLFEKPITYLFSKDAKKRHHIMNCVEPLSSKFLKKEQS
jgi:hypothetical protein